MHEPVCSSQLEPLSIQNATTSRPQQRDSVSALSRHRANVGPTDHMRLRPRPYCGDMRSRLRKSLAVPGCAKRVLESLGVPPKLRDSMGATATTRQLYHGAPPRRRIQRLNQSICSSEVAALPSRKSRVRSPPVELPYHMTRSQLRSAKGHQWYKSSHRRLGRPQFTPTPLSQTPNEPRSTHHVRRRPRCPRHRCVCARRWLPRWPSRRRRDPRLPRPPYVPLAAVVAYADQCNATEPSCNGTDTSLAIYAPGSCSPIGYSQLIGESRLCGGAISDGFTTGAHHERFRACV
jgi:hypothetical protein